MKCQFCENEANVFYTQMVDGKSKEMNLCDSCAEIQGITSLEEFKIAETLMNDEMPNMRKEGDSIATVSHCSNCGFTLEDLRKIGRLGCSRCYAEFGLEIQSMMKNMHRGMEHKGRTPVGMIAEMKKKRKLSELKTALDKAVEDENYEEAGELRDQLAAYKASSGEKGKTK